jgi:hypothetical protein
MLYGIFSVINLQRSGCREAKGYIDDEITANSRCCLLFGNGIRSECAPEKQQQTAGSGKTERAGGLQTRWNGPGHKAMGW